MPDAVATYSSRLSTTLSRAGLHEEAASGRVVGGLLWLAGDHRRAEIGVLIAPDLRRRFERLEVTPEGTFLIRVDNGSRCRIEVDPLTAEIAAACDVVTVIEAPAHGEDGTEERYEIPASLAHEHEPAPTFM